MKWTKPVEIAIKAEVCKRDGLCARVCPARIFRLIEGAVPNVERAHECVLCGQCLAICPSAAIDHSRLSAGRQRRIENKQLPADGEAVHAALLLRRSVRCYRDKEVAREILEEIGLTAGYAPTGAFGHEGWIRVVTIASGAETMRRVREATVRYMRKLYGVLDGFVVKSVAHFSEQARSGRASLPDLKMRLREWDAGRDAITYNAPAAVFVSAGYDTSTPHEDCDSALMNMMLAAHARGLGTCWNGWLGNAALASHVSGPRELGDLLGIPENHRVVEAFTVGWPAVHLHSLPERQTRIRWVE